MAGSWELRTNPILADGREQRPAAGPSVRLTRDERARLVAAMSRGVDTTIVDRRTGRVISRTPALGVTAGQRAAIARLSKVKRERMSLETAKAIAEASRLRGQAR